MIMIIIIDMKEQLIKKSRLEDIIDRRTPIFVKRACVWAINLLPERWATWIFNNKMKSIFIFYTIRGLFLRPSMWILYAAAFSYIGMN